MPDKRTHRGPHPQDVESFKPSVWPELRRAVADMSWLLSRGYADKSVLKLVGDRFQLNQRQRMAVMRCACSDFALSRRRQNEISRDYLTGQDLLVDGYNVLTTIEAALAGGVVITGRDGCYRDLASMHGTFRKVKETGPAIKILGKTLKDLNVQHCRLYLDSPVSNSGRLKTTILEHADKQGWNWEVELVHNPDSVLSDTDEIIASADSIILDHCRRWFNLAREIVATSIPDANVINISAC